MPDNGTNSMRIGIVTPYSWTYAGGVNRHVHSLADALIARGHEVRVLAPWDPEDRLTGVPDPALEAVRLTMQHLRGIVE